MRGSRSGTGGFTLLEILLALSIFAILLVLLVGGFSGAARTYDALRGREVALRQVAGALDRIGSDLSGAVDSPRAAELHLECRSATLAGFPASSVQFGAFTAPEGASSRPSTDLCKVRYSVRITEEGDRLDLYRERSDLPLVESRIPAREGRVARGLRGFEVELYDGKGWVKEWPPEGAAAGVLPARAAVTVLDGDGNRFRRVVQLHLSGNEANLLRSGRRTETGP